jgi:CDP-diacylglycerol--glycerol-3-phosphate 3-phosphatidyltransferase
VEALTTEHKTCPLLALAAQSLYNSSMNWPNGLTLLRIVLIPAILYFVLVPGPNFGLIALGLFALAALTDAADGYLARWRRNETTLGRFVKAVLIPIVVAVTVISGAEYFYRFRQLLRRLS